MSFPTRRTSKDPLVRGLLDKYKFNLLSVPRAETDVYDLYIGRGREILPPDRLENLFSGTPSLPEPHRGENFKLPEISFSSLLEIDAATKIVGKLFSAHNLTVDEASLTAAIKQDQASKARLRFRDVTRDSVKPLAVHRALQAWRIARDAADLIGGKDLYLVVGVVRAKGLEIAFSDDARNERKIEGGAGIAQAANIAADGKVSMTTSNSGTLVFQGPDRIGFGVELVELTVKRSAGHVAVGGLPPAVDVRDDHLVEPTFIGREDGPIFI